MDLSVRSLPEPLRSAFADHGVAELYPPQAEAMGPVLAGESIVLAVPTASGKTLVAYGAVLNAVSRGGRALYIVPLKALASEKYDELRAMEPFGVRAAITIGDYDRMEDLEGRNVLVATSERVDSLLRHRAEYLEGLSVAVADEVHLITDPGRGPALEVVLARLRQLNPALQVVALSATIRNSEELAAWLGARHLRSDWRPVKLRTGVILSGQVEYDTGEIERVDPSMDPVEALVMDCLRGGGQTLVFVATRRSAESLAERLAGTIAPALSLEDLDDLREVRDRVAQEGEGGISLRLQRALEGGAAFHHAGLSTGQRKAIEDAFRAGKVRVLCATPTLAAGINLPARRVVVRDLKRYDPSLGSVPIPVLGVRQMCGRAARPRYDTEGDAVLVTKSARGRESVWARYVVGETEPMESKLGAETALRTHILASVAAGYVTSKGELRAFMDRTFYAHQFGTDEVWAVVLSALGFLISHGLVDDRDGLRPTRFGGLASSLYIDPLTAVHMRECLREADRPSVLALLHVLASTPDIRPLFLRSSEYALYRRMAEGMADAFLLGKGDAEDTGRPGLRAGTGRTSQAGGTGGSGTGRGLDRWAVASKPPSPAPGSGGATSEPGLADGLGFSTAADSLGRSVSSGSGSGIWLLDRRTLLADESFLSALKTARALYDWMEESPLPRMEEVYGLGPGDVHQLTSTAEWLAYALSRIARNERPDLEDQTRSLALRLRLGIREDALEIASLEGIGRVRARTLIDAGYRSLRALAEAPVEELAGIRGIGPVLAGRVRVEAAERLGRSPA